MWFTVRPVQPSDAPDWLSMRQMLWPSELDDHASDLQLIARHERGQPAGVAELSIRSVVEGCEPGAVGFLEG